MKRLFAVATCLVLMGCPVSNSPTPVTPVVAEPDMKELVADIVPYSVPELAEFYTDFAGVIERDGDVIVRTNDIREAHRRAGKLAFQKTGMVEKTAGLGDKVDAAIAAALGKDNVALTPELRERAASIMKAIAWAVE